MNILVDTHTHTNASVHAYSTLEENIRHAKEVGLEAIAMTNHAPAIPDAPHIWHFINAPKCIPREVNGVKILFGAEVNILDEDGNVDIQPGVLSALDVVIASMHRDVFAPATRKIHTQAYLNVLDNPYVDIIGHSGSPDYEYNIEQVLSKAKKVATEDQKIEIENLYREFLINAEKEKQQKEALDREEDIIRQRVLKKKETEMIQKEKKSWLKTTIIVGTCTVVLLICTISSFITRTPSDTGTNSSWIIYSLFLTIPSIIASAYFIHGYKTKSDDFWIKRAKKHR